VLPCPMVLVHWNWHLVMFGIALAERLHGNHSGAKVAVVALVALVGLVTPTELFVDVDQRAPGGGHALGEGP